MPLPNSIHDASSPISNIYNSHIYVFVRLVQLQWIDATRSVTNSQTVLVNAYPRRSTLITCSPKEIDLQLGVPQGRSFCCRPRILPIHSPFHVLANPSTPGLAAPMRSIFRIRLAVHRHIYISYRPPFQLVRHRFWSAPLLLLPTIIERVRSVKKAIQLYT